MLDCDLDSARRFLRALAFGRDAAHTFTVWPEAEASGARPMTPSGTLEELADELVANNRDGAGISVCVSETNLRGCQLEDIERPRAMFCDFDAGEPHPREFDAAQPSVWVATVRGAHAYWLLQEDIAIAQVRWSDIQRALQRRLMAERMGSPNKVLRVPGFWHWKGGSAYKGLPPAELEPKRIALVYCKDEPGFRYDPEDLVRAYGLTIEEPKPAPPIDLGGVSYSARTKRCRRFVDHCGGAVAGGGGYSKTKGMCGIGYDFGLEPDEYWPILQDWNDSCDPPWKEPELRRKLDRIFALLRSGGSRKPFGWRLFENRTPPADLIREGVMMPDVPWPDDDDAPSPERRHLYVVHPPTDAPPPGAPPDAKAPEQRTIKKGPVEPPEDPWQRFDGEEGSLVVEPPGDAPPPTDADAPDDGSGGDPPDTLILDPQAPVRSARRFLAWRFMQNGMRTVTHHIRAWWRWTGAAYSEVSREDIVHRIYVFSDPAVRYNDRGSLVPFNPDETKVNKIRHALESECHIDDAREPPCWLAGDASGDKPRPAPHEIVACKNGLLHLPTQKWLGRRPDYFTRTALDVAYDPNAAEPVRWMQFLDELWPEDKESQGLLQEWFGLTLVPDTSFQKLLLVVGPKRGGKGTIARILAALHGKAACAWPKMDDLVKNFGLWPLITATVAILPDVRISHQLDVAAAIETILRITGEDPFQIDRKNLPILSGVRIPSRLMLMSNLPPRLADPGNAFSSRCLTLNLEQTWFGKEDRHLERKLKAELPGILLWAMEGWKRLNARGHFEQPQTGKALMQEVEDLSNPLGAFVRQRCELHKGVVQYGDEDAWFTSNDELFAAWQRWCESEGRMAIGEKSTMIRNLRGNYPQLRPIRVLREFQGKKLRPRGLVGIRVRYDEDEVGDGGPVQQSWGDEF